jgi:ketosteroid isomerase-like protein
LTAAAVGNGEDQDQTRSHIASGGTTMGIDQDRRTVEEIVRSLDDQERLAALYRDIPALESLWSEEFVVNAPNNEVVLGRAAVLNTFVRAGIINFFSFEREIEFVRVDGAFVIIMGLETIEPVSNSPSAGLVAGQIVTRRFTNIWKNESDTWRLAIRHANTFIRR